MQHRMRRLLSTHALPPSVLVLTLRRVYPMHPRPETADDVRQREPARTHSQLEPPQRRAEPSPRPSRPRELGHLVDVQPMVVHRLEHDRHRGDEQAVPVVGLPDERLAGPLARGEAVAEALQCGLSLGEDVRRVLGGGDHGGCGGRGEAHAVDDDLRGVEVAVRGLGGGRRRELLDPP